MLYDPTSIPNAVAVYYLVYMYSPISKERWLLDPYKL